MNRWRDALDRWADLAPVVCFLLILLVLALEALL